RIYRLKAFMSNGMAWETTPYLLGEEVKQQLEVEQLARIIPNRYEGGPVITLDGQQLKERNSATVDENWFNMFHYDFVQGSAEAFNSQPFSVILSESTAKKYFGTEIPIGQTLRIDTVDYQVRGII